MAVPSRRWIFFAFVILMNIAGISAQGVLKFTDKNFAKFRAKNEEKGFLAMFYAPWCGHCKVAKPELMAAAKELGAGDPKVGGVDCTANTKICKKLEIQGYPTFLWFKGGMVWSQEDDLNPEFITMLTKRDKKSFLGFLRSMSTVGSSGKEEGKASEIPEQPKAADKPKGANAVTELKDDNFAEFTQKHDQEGVLVMGYASWCGICKRAQPEFEAAATKLQAEGLPGKFAAIDATANDKFKTDFDVHGYPTFVYLKGGKRYGQQDWINQEFSQAQLQRDEKSFLAFMKSQANAPKEEL
eukprot:gb/GEZN01011614.1/.p1 GENE.gb/GEZN01011614.1/~~gb/GEZN01011614.1/.p1  ORF type:complete len:298 (+),score=72.08 gb/GEZN01011614.1/:5-898(+)